LSFPFRDAPDGFAVGGASDRRGCTDVSFDAQIDSTGAARWPANVAVNNNAGGGTGRPCRIN
jgi:hypothetical protein